MHTSGAAGTSDFVQFELNLLKYEKKFKKKGGIYATSDQGGSNYLINNGSGKLTYRECSCALSVSNTW